MTEDITNNDENDAPDLFMPSLSELFYSTSSLEQLDELVFAVEAGSEIAAHRKATSQIASQFNLNTEDVRIKNIEEFLEIPAADMECTGPITRFQTLCWADNTPFKMSKKFNEESRAKDAMKEFKNKYEDIRQKGTVMTPLGPQRIQLPSLRETQFKCALNEMITKELCNLTPRRVRRPEILWSVQAENPLRD